MSASYATSSMASATYAAPGQAAARTYFFVTGDAGSELLPRILGPFAKLGLSPYRVYASTEQGQGEEMSIELRFLGLQPGQVQTLAARFRAVVGVRSVMTVSGD